MHESMRLGAKQGAVMSRNILSRRRRRDAPESIKRIFVKEGYTVDGAESAERGLSFLETGVYDVILTDVILPGMDGDRDAYLGMATGHGPDHHRRNRLCVVSP
jgi:PleD family two-component response regulator